MKTFIAERIFEICNQHKTERLSVDSFLLFVRKLIGSNVKEKLKLIFDIHDINGNKSFKLLNQIIKNKICLKKI